MNESNCIVYFPSPVGELLLASNGKALAALEFPGAARERRKRLPASPRPDAILVEACCQLRAYFAGKLQQFDLPLAPEGTEFQRTVWRELTRIPYGHTISYAELARRVGNPRASRAVGSANGKNPIAIIIPCHRVIAADGSLGGFSGGLETKERLLALESTAIGRPARANTNPKRPVVSLSNGKRVNRVLAGAR